MRKLSSEAFLLAAILAGIGGAACSLDNAREAGGKITIILKDAEGELRQMADLFQISSGPRVFSDPFSASEFQCFAVNITGPGVPVQSDKLKNCSSPDNFRGHGIGSVSELKRRGEPIEVTVPAGPSRIIDVYGAFPTPQECGGGGYGNTPSGPPFERDEGGGYFLGSVQRALTADVTVSVPVSYDFGGKSVVCSGDYLKVNSLFPNGSSMSGGPLRINGHNFKQGVLVEFPMAGYSPTPCTVTSVTESQINCTAATFPNVGTADLRVRNPDGQEQFFSNAYNVISGGQHLAIVPDVQLDFGNQAVSAGPKILTIEVKNYGGSSFGTGSTTLSAPFSFQGGAGAMSSSQCGGTLAAGAFCDFTIEFDPSSVGSFSQTLVSSGATTNFSITLTGRGF